MKFIPIKNLGDFGYPDEFDKDMIEELQNSVETSGVTLSDNNYNQLSESTSNYVACGDFYIDNGIANKYVLNPSGSFVYPKQYINGMRVRFYITNTNTGASTIEIKPDGIMSLGIKSIKKNGGTQELDAGDLIINTYAELYFLESKDCFVFLYINSQHNINGNIAQIIFNNKGSDAIYVSGAVFRLNPATYYLQYGYSGTEIQALETSIIPIYNDSVIELTLETVANINCAWIDQGSSNSNQAQMYAVISLFLNPTSSTSLSVACTHIGTTQYIKPFDQMYWTIAKPIKLKYTMQNTGFNKKTFKFHAGRPTLADSEYQWGITSKPIIQLGEGSVSSETTDDMTYKANTYVSIIEYAKT